MGGGTDSRTPRHTDWQGLSPRGRGNQIEPPFSRPSPRSIPAWAGEPSDPYVASDELWVYPRVGGGTKWPYRPTARPAGLSPRGRGNPVLYAVGTGLPGSIPAWAGEPCGRQLCMIARRVYPRVGGGTGKALVRDDVDGGLSPRGRGNPRSKSLSPGWAGSIPAWAGEPLPLLREILSARVYPRVGGGTYIGASVSSYARGLSPRGRGNPPF